MPPKPDKKLQPRAYRAWVKRELRRWDPADDQGTAPPGMTQAGTDAYTPRVDGILWEPVKKKDMREVKETDIHYSADAAKLLGRHKHDPRC